MGKKANEFSSFVNNAAFPQIPYYAYILNKRQLTIEVLFCLITSFQNKYRHIRYKVRVNFIYNNKKGKAVDLLGESCRIK